MCKTTEARIRRCRELTENLERSAAQSIRNEYISGRIAGMRHLMDVLDGKH